MRLTNFFPLYSFTKALENHDHDTIHYNKVDIETELGEKERQEITAVNPHNAREEAIKFVANNRRGLEGTRSASIEVHVM